MRYTADEIRQIEFGNAPIGRRGYAKSEVDEFLERVAKTLVDEDDLTAAEVHHVIFSRPLLGKRGYDEHQVDDFLDEVEEDLIDRTGAAPSAHEVPAARDNDREIPAEPGSFAGGTAWR